MENNEVLKIKADNVLNLIDVLLEDVIKEKAVNEQWFINFLDRLNSISVMY